MLKEPPVKLDDIWSFFVPLESFKMETASQKIGETLHLRELGQEEKNYLFEAPLFDLSEIRALESRFGISSSYAQGQWSDRTKIIVETHSLITAFRLHMAGNIGASAAYETNGRIRKTSAGEFKLGGLEVRPSCSEYLLAEDAWSKILILFQFVKDETSGKAPLGLESAIRRFNLSYARYYSEDRIVDLTISLESSLLQGDNVYKKKSILAKRSAAILGDDNTFNIPDLLGAMYNVRNEIVHGGKHLFELQDKLSKRHSAFSLQEFPEVCEEAVRCILKAYIDIGVRTNFSVKAINELLRQGKALHEF